MSIASVSKIFIKYFPINKYYLVCFISICYCIYETLLLQIFEYFNHELSFDDLRESILDSLDSHRLINANLVEIFDNIIMQFLLRHISFILEHSKLTFGYYRCSSLAYWFNIEIHVFLTKLFHLYLEYVLHLIDLLTILILPLLFGCFLKSLLLLQG